MHPQTACGEMHLHTGIRGCCTNMEGDRQTDRQTDEQTGDSSYINTDENLWNVIMRKMYGQSHQSKPSCLNVCSRSGIKSPNINVKDWWRAHQHT
ncbi:hypothetical protein UPYG_G00016720 [Umbra pygmaea]|uniref:Uncharacterized protein n=1 Tax=Umbra pygmaea TaxID=75934 RepID=A0ABD0XJV6_UMBPY